MRASGGVQGAHHSLEVLFLQQLAVAGVAVRRRKVRLVLVSKTTTLIMERSFMVVEVVGSWW